MAVRPVVLSRAFFAAAAVAVPWTVYLALTLPRHYSAHHYWLGWSGFNVALVLALVATGRSLVRGTESVSRYASIACTLLVVDAWFDVVNASTDTDRLVAIGMAAVVELPLAVVCWLLSTRRLRAGRSPTPRG